MNAYTRKTVRYFDISIDPIKQNIPMLSERVEFFKTIYILE